MDKQKLDELKQLIGKELKGISYDDFNEDDEGFELIFADNVRLEVYDLGEDGLGWCISRSEGKDERTSR